MTRESRKFHYRENSQPDSAKFGTIDPPLNKEISLAIKCKIRQLFARASAFHIIREKQFTGKPLNRTGHKSTYLDRHSQRTVPTFWWRRDKARFPSFCQGLGFPYHSIKAIHGKAAEPDGTQVNVSRPAQSKNCSNLQAGSG